MYSAASWCQTTCTRQHPGSSQHGAPTQERESAQDTAGQSHPNTTNIYRTWYHVRIYVCQGPRADQEGLHFSRERGCTRDDHGKAGPFSVERLKIDLPFVNVFVCTNKYTAKCRPLLADLHFKLRVGLRVATVRGRREVSVRPGRGHELWPVPWAAAGRPVVVAELPP